MFPRLLHIYGPLWVRSYGFMIALGFLFFLYFSYNHRLRKKIISGELYLNMVFIGLLSGIVGGRLLFVLMEWNTFFDHWSEIFFPWVGGFVLLGSMIGILVALPLYLWFNRIRVLPVLDLVATFAPLLESFSRIGCFLAGCCYGMISSGSCFLSAVTFTHFDGSAPVGVPLYPTQLYLSLGSFVIFLFLRWIILPRVHKPGILLFIYLILTSILRFVVDFWRGDRGDLVTVFMGPGNFVDLSYVQLYVLSFFLVSLAGFVLSVWLQKKLNIYQ